MSDRPRVGVIINPIAGDGATPARARRRAVQCAHILRGLGIEPDVHISEWPGHARELVPQMVARGADTVVAWGGDGTVNEVAAGVLATPAALSVIPAGSGNGLARMLGMPADAARALPRIVHGTDRRIDVGRIDGVLFVNLAGVGFDAHIAAAFATMGGRRRGFLRYASKVLGALRTYSTATYDIALDHAPAFRQRAFLVSFANGRQWGNGAVIAPRARLDDGLLDAVVVEERGRPAILCAIPRLFTGTIERAPGVTIQPVREALIGADGPLTFHADGEPFRARGNVVRIQIFNAALRLRA